MICPKRSRQHCGQGLFIPKILSYCGRGRNPGNVILLVVGNVLYICEDGGREKKCLKSALELRVHRFLWPIEAYSDSPFKLHLSEWTS